MKTTFTKRSVTLSFAVLLMFALILCSAIGVMFSRTANAVETPPVSAVELIDDSTTIAGLTPVDGQYVFTKGDNRDADSFCYPFHNNALDNDRCLEKDDGSGEYFPSKELYAQMKFKWDISAKETDDWYNEFGAIIGAFGDKYLTVSLYRCVSEQTVPIFGWASKGDASTVNKIDGSIDWTNAYDQAALFEVGNTIEFTIDKSPSEVTANMKIATETATLERTITLDVTKIDGLNSVGDLSLAFGPSRRATGGTFYDYSCKVWGHTHVAAESYTYDDAEHWHACTVCGKHMDAEGHTITEGVTKEATCAEAGEKTLSCSVCGYVKTVAIPKLPHTITENITKEPTRTEEGEKTLSCSVCGHTETIIIPKLRDEFTAGNTTLAGAEKQQDGSFVFEKNGVQSYLFANTSFTNDFYIKADGSGTVSSKELTANISFKWKIGEFTGDGGDRLGAVIGKYDNKDLSIYCFFVSSNRVCLTFQYGTQILNFWGANWDLNGGAEGYFAKDNILEFTVVKSSTDIEARLTVKNSSGEALPKTFVVRLSESFTDSGVTAFSADQVTLAFGPFMQGVGGTLYDYSVKFEDDIRANYVYVDGDKIRVPDACAGETGTIDFNQTVLQGPLATAPSGYKVEIKIGDGAWTVLAENTQDTSMDISINENVAANSNLTVRVTPIAEGMTVLSGEKTVQIAEALPRLDTPRNVRVDDGTLRYGVAPTIRWDAVSDATYYKLEYKRGNGSWETLYEGESTYFVASAFDSVESVTYRVTAAQAEEGRTHRPSLAGTTGELTVAKGVNLSVPTLAALVEQTKITVDAVNGCEYRISDGAWQDSNIFEGLTADTEYTVHIRFKETETMQASEPVSQKFTTLPAADSRAIELIDGETTMEEHTPSSGKYTFEMPTGNKFQYLFSNSRLDYDLYYKADAETSTDYYSSKVLNAQLTFQWKIGELSNRGGDRLGAVIGTYNGKNLSVYCWGGSNNRVSLTYQYGSTILNFWGSNWDLGNGAGYFVTGNVLEFTVIKSGSDIVTKLTVKDAEGTVLPKTFIVRLSESFQDTELASASFSANDVTLAFGAFLQDAGGEFYDCSCKVWHDTDILTTPGAHEHRVSTDFLCTDTGHYNVCTICGQHLDGEDHTFTETVIKEATCAEEGEKKLSCSVCGYEKTVAIPKLEHTITESITKEATCSEEGIKTLVCTECGHTETVAIPKIPHTFDEYVTKDPTRTEEGEKTFTCTVCGHTETVTVPKLRDEFTAGDTTYGDAIKQKDGSFVFEKQGGVHSYPFDNTSFTNDLYIKADGSGTVSSKELTANLSFKWKIGDVSGSGGDRLGAVIGTYNGKDLFVYCWGGSNNRVSLTFQYGTQILNFWGANWDLGNGAGYFVKGNILEFTVTKSSNDIEARLTVKNSSGEALSKTFVVRLSESFTDSGVTAFSADQVTLAFGPFMQDAGGTFYDYSVTFEEDIRANYVYVDGDKIEAPDVRAGETAVIDFSQAILQGPLATVPSGYKVEMKIGDGEWVVLAENTQDTSVKISIGEDVAVGSNLVLRVTPIANGMLVLFGEKTVQVAELLPRLATPANVHVDGDTLRYGVAPTVRWDEVAGATRYTLERKCGDGEWEILYEGTRTYFSSLETVDSFIPVIYRVTAMQTEENRTHRPSLAGVTEELIIAKGIYPSNPTLTAVAEETKITVDAVDSCEYRLNDGAWQDSNVFEGLAANTEYTISIRFKGTDTMEVGEIVSEKFTTQSIAEPTNIPADKGCNSAVAISGGVISALVLIAASTAIILVWRKKKSKK